MMKEFPDEVQGINVGQNITNLRYTDDAVFVTVVMMKLNCRQ